MTINRHPPFPQLRLTMILLLSVKYILFLNKISFSITFVDIISQMGGW